MGEFETYLAQHPQISKKRAEDLRKNGCMYTGKGFAYLTKNLNWDTTVRVDVDDLTCECGVYNTKRACPHIAALIGIKEDNGGKIPVTDSRKIIQEELDRLKKEKDSSYFSWRIAHFVGRVSPFAYDLPAKEKKQFILEMAELLNSKVYMDNFFIVCENCFFNYDWGESKKTVGSILFENRQKYRWPVISLLKQSYSVFDDEQKRIIVQEIAADEKLTEQFLPVLGQDYIINFSREKQVEYFKAADMKTVSSSRIEKVLHGWMEDPPLYEEYLSMVERLKDDGYMDLNLEDVKKLKDAGYGDRMGTVVQMLVRRIRSVEDYKRVMKCIPQEMFLPAWKDRRNSEASRHWYYSGPSEYEIQIDFLVDPEAKPENYDLENKSVEVLDTIMQTRPEYAKELCNLVRKDYRYQLKFSKPNKSREYLLVLARNGDSIASKYVSDESEYDRNGDDLVYLTAIGMHFDTLPKIAPELKKVEGSHAAGQNR